MRVTRVGWVVVGLCGTLLACSHPPQVDVRAEEAAIRDLDRRWQEAFTAKDLDGLAGFFDESAILMPAHGPAVVGRQAIRSAYEQWLPRPGVTTSFAPEVVEVARSGDFAYDRGTFQFSMETAEGRVEDQGKYLVVWKRIGSQWKAIVDISNSDLPEPRRLPRDDEGEPSVDE